MQRSSVPVYMLVVSLAGCHLGYKYSHGGRSFKMSQDHIDYHRAAMKDALAAEQASDGVPGLKVACDLLRERALNAPDEWASNFVPAKRLLDADAKSKCEEHNRAQDESDRKAAAEEEKRQAEKARAEEAERAEAQRVAGEAARLAFAAELRRVNVTHDDPDLRKAAVAFVRDALAGRVRVRSRRYNWDVQKAAILIVQSSNDPAFSKDVERLMTARSKYRSKNDRSGAAATKAMRTEACITLGRVNPTQHIGCYEKLLKLSLWWLHGQGTARLALQPEIARDVVERMKRELAASASDDDARIPLLTAITMLAPVEGRRLLRGVSVKTREDVAAVLATIAIELHEARPSDSQALLRVLAELMNGLSRRKSRTAIALALLLHGQSQFEPVLLDGIESLKQMKEGKGLFAAPVGVGPVARAFGRFPASPTFAKRVMSVVRSARNRHAREKLLERFALLPGAEKFLSELAPMISDELPGSYGTSGLSYAEFKERAKNDRVNDLSKVAIGVVGYHDPAGFEVEFRRRLKNGRRSGSTGSLDQLARLLAERPEERHRPALKLLTRAKSDHHVVLGHIGLARLGDRSSLAWLTKTLRKRTAGAGLRMAIARHVIARTIPMTVWKG